MTYSKDDIIHCTPEDIFSWMLYIRERGSMYIDKEDIFQLVAFVNGYVSSYKATSQNIWWVFDRFKTFVSNKHEDCWANNRGNLASIYFDLAQNKDSTAVDLFWADWDEFVKRAEELIK